MQADPRTSLLLEVQVRRSRPRGLSVPRPPSPHQPDSPRARRHWRCPSPPRTRAPASPLSWLSGPECTGTSLQRQVLREGASPASNSTPGLGRRGPFQLRGPRSPKNRDTPFECGPSVPLEATRPPAGAMYPWVPHARPPGTDQMRAGASGLPRLPRAQLPPHPSAHPTASTNTTGQVAGPPSPCPCTGRGSGGNHPPCALLQAAQLSQAPLRPDSPVGTGWGHRVALASAGLSPPPVTVMSGPHSPQQKIGRGKAPAKPAGGVSKEQAPVSVHSWECALVLPAGQTHAGPSPGSPGQGPLIIDPSALLPPGRDLPPDPASPRCPGALAPTAACGGGGRTGPRTPF